MKPSMQIGNTATVEFIVSEKMQPRFDGIIIHPVCSTWDLAHQFEITSRKALVPHLEDGEEGIGTHLSIDHLAPALLGQKVKITSTVIKIDESTVICSIQGKCGNSIIATGEQIQRVFPIEVVDRIIANANN